MKKVLFAVCLTLTTGLFASCQKGENFFHGTWQAVGEYYYEDKYGNDYPGVYTIELTLAKKSGDAQWVENYPENQKNNIERKGTYKFYNDNTISVTFPETRDEDEMMLILSRLTTDDSRLYGDDRTFTKVKNK